MVGVMLPKYDEAIHTGMLLFAACSHLPNHGARTMAVYTELVAHAYGKLNITVVQDIMKKVSV